MKKWVRVHWQKLPLITLAALLGGDILHLLILNHGTFVYALDDPYISMRMAENIARGHYGMNLGEYASASSSILWPFLLVPFAWLGLLDIAPLLINVLGGAAAVHCITRGIAFVFRKEEKKLWPQLTLISCLLVPALNIPGLILIGMEHVLQLLLMALVATNLVRMQEAEAPPPLWVYGVLILLPLIRYEGLAVSGVALLLLMRRGQVKQVMVTGIAIALFVGGFSFYLMSLGLSPLPHSALNKLVVGGAWWQRMLANTGQAELWLMVAGLYAFALAAYKAKRRQVRGFAFMLALPLLAQVMVGRLGNGYRFEPAVLGFSVLILLYLHRGALADLLHKEPPQRSLVRITVALLCLFYVYVGHSMWWVAVASNEIYLQQKQMADFVQHYYKKPVAVNDIGYVNYKNPDYVLDVVGISSAESRTAVQRVAMQENVAPIYDLIRKHNIGLMMVYGTWFREYVPEGWKAVAHLSFSHVPVATQGAIVTFYAAPTETKAAHFALKKYTPTVPVGAYLDIIGK